MIWFQLALSLGLILCGIRAFSPPLFALSSIRRCRIVFHVGHKAKGRNVLDDDDDDDDDILCNDEVLEGHQHVEIDVPTDAASTLATIDDRELMLQSLGLDPRNNDALLEYSIDSFLRGDYDRPFEDDAMAPLPGLSPGTTVEQALEALRRLDDPEPSHGAACFLRFCVPLRRAERWSPAMADKPGSSWKELLRGSLTPTMFSRRVRASQEFSSLLDWERMDVTEGAVNDNNDFALEDSVALVNVALYFGGGGGEKYQKIKSNSTTLSDTTLPELLQIKLNRVGGVWLIESVQSCPKSLYQEEEQF